jgi:hypothetical protein
MLMLQARGKEYASAAPRIGIVDAALAKMNAELPIGLPSTRTLGRRHNSGTRPSAPSSGRINLCRYYRAAETSSIAPRQTSGRTESARWSVRDNNRQTREGGGSGFPRCLLTPE